MEAEILATVLPVVLVAAGAIYVWYLVAKNMAQIAADKGYTERKWFHFCFWLRFVGFLMICAMPDKRNRIKGSICTDQWGRK